MSATTPRSRPASARPSGNDRLITIYHKPNCSTSRRVLQMIRDAGYEPRVVDYIRQGWDRDTLAALLAAAGLTPAQALRVKGTDAALRGLIGAEDATILDHMVANPALVERPIVAGPGGTRLCRPVECVTETFGQHRLFPCASPC